jgi:hypothetical protein
MRNELVVYKARKAGSLDERVVEVDVDDLGVDPIVSREELRRMFDGEQIVVRPQRGDFYVAEGTLLPLNLFSLRLGVEGQPPKARDSEESTGPRSNGWSRGLSPSCSSTGCAGAVGALNTLISLGFERRIAA